MRNSSRTPTLPIGERGASHAWETRLSGEKAGIGAMSSSLPASGGFFGARSASFGASRPTWTVERGTDRSAKEEWASGPRIRKWIPTQARRREFVGVQLMKAPSTRAPGPSFAQLDCAPGPGGRARGNQIIRAAGLRVTWTARPALRKFKIGGCLTLGL